MLDKLQCAYCIRNKQHGGECQGKQDLKPCTLFKQDPRGCIRNRDIKLRVPFFFNVPIKVWCDYWEIKGRDTEIKINQVYAFEWDKNDGKLIISCNIDYYINDIDNDEIAPIFSVIEGGVK